VGRKEGWAGGLLGVLREKEEERRWAALGWNERRERGLGCFFLRFFSTILQLFKLLKFKLLFKL
jgi:hypothetical protein